MPAALVGSSNENVRATWIEDHIGDAGVVADIKNALPGFAAVGSFVKAPVASRTPQRSLASDINRVRIARVDDNLADVLRSFEANVFPTLSAVLRAVDAVAVSDAALTVVLAGADPDDAGILWVEANRTDGIRSFVVKDRRPSDYGVV